MLTSKQKRARLPVVFGLEGPRRQEHRGTKIHEVLGEREGPIRRTREGGVNGS
jgi:hypothetical protein